MRKTREVTDMLDERRVSLMTKLAIYEKHEENRDLVMARYYARDYVRFNVLKTWVASTVAYWSIIGGYVFLNFEKILSQISDMDYFAVMYKMLFGYAVFCAVYFLFASAVYNYRYMHAKKGLIDYNVNMKELIKHDSDKGHVVDHEHSGIRETATRSFSTDRPARGRVSRMDMINKKLAEEEDEKRQEIIDNMNRLKEKNAEKARMERERQKQIEAEKARIRERRRQLEAEQLEKIRSGRQEEIHREDYTYQRDGRDIDPTGRSDRS